MSTTDDAPDSTPSPLEELSPAVRRLVRQFDLDITGIHGTGPAGRIRVGDVMGLLGGRQDSGNRDAPARMAELEGDVTGADDAETEHAAAEAAPATPLPLPAASETAPHSSVPTTSVFDCDLSCVLAHRKRLHRDSNELLTPTSYVLTALASALDATPELAAGRPARFGVWLTTPDGAPRPTLIDLPDPLPETLEARARAFDSALRMNLDTDLGLATLLVHAYADSGSLLATPTPIGAGHSASIGIGRIRREIVIRIIDGVETPRVAPRCYLSISFFDDRVPFQRANRALADCVRVLESWPD